jgi:hypothetical protein
MEFKKQIVHRGRRFYKAMVTTEFVYYADYQEGDDNGNVVMLDRENGELLSDNYFGNQDMFERMRKFDFESMSRTCAYNFKCILEEDILPSFEAWIEDGNVIKMKGGYATQDAQYSNRLKTKKDLLKYFVKEFGE